MLRRVLCKAKRRVTLGRPTMRLILDARRRPIEVHFASVETARATIKAPLDRIVGGEETCGPAAYIVAYQNVEGIVRYKA